ncbi:hypothetical protein FTO70_05935 [Methanosarcina sp. KYL-1]|uniref:hypothetical protein n=1 Tax=Methanosarcina sp. KYL-1 TaxID=2602068 RepID=UPI002101A24A|nr:hypothetical protein [Methanosarcina sp. KYL-1]MCQ1535235.1 hypothetical protein [Methanosarcina sp. KYL-1]
MQMKKNQIFTLLSIFCFILQSRNLFLLRNVQPVGYVVDIYSMLPLSFYLGLIICYLVATFLVLNGMKKVGTLILCLNHFEILIIPYMLGYYSMGRADDMGYIGEYLHIATSGHFGSWNIYPASHIIGASISVISDLEAHETSFIIPIIFSFVFISGIYLYSRELFSNSCIHSLVLVSSFILYIGIYNYLNVPHALFFAFMPLYLCYFYKYLGRYNDTSYSIIFVLMTLLIPFTHPFIVYFLFVVFLFHLIPKYISSSNIEVLKIPKIKVYSYLILIVSFIFWYIYSEIIIIRFEKSYVSFINRITEPVFVETTDKLAKLNFDFFDYIQLFSFFYGRYLIPTLIILISIIYLYFRKDLLKVNTLKNYPYLLTFYLLLLIIQMILLLNPIISHQPDRVMNLNFVVYAQIPLFACALYLLFLENSKSLYKLLIVCGILSFIWTLSLFGCLDSPNVYRTNVALTHNEVQGMDWFYEVKDESIVSAPMSQINRFQAILGDQERRYGQNNTADHFGYLNSSGNFMDVNLGLGKGTYVIILTIDELLYQEVPGYKAVGRFTKEDFDRFRNDKSVNKIYDSVNIEIFKS